MKFQKKILDNGLTVLFEKRDVPVTTVMLGTKFGAAYENEKEKGIAHFLEHLAFKGTKNRTAEEISRAIEKVGGDFNAFTSEEKTFYHVKLPSKHIELAMDVLFDIFFNPLHDSEEIKKECNVIIEEIKMYRDNPRAYCMEKLKSCLYKAPFGMFIAGTEENIKNMTREQLVEKYREMYFPKNAILSVVGNNDFSEIIGLAEKLCKNIQGKEPEIKEIEFQNLQIKENRDNLQQANVCIGFHFPKANDEKRYAADVFTAIFGQGMSSKLFTEVREKRGLAYAVKSDIDDGKEYSYLFIYIGTEKEKVDEVIKICIEEFRKMANITEKELEDGKRQLIGNFEINSEASENTAMSLIDEEISGKAEDYYEYEKRINEVTLKDIKELSEIKDYAYFALLP